MAFTLLSLISCQKSTLSKGLYFADTQDGIIYLELNRGTDCVMFFQDSDYKDNGYYRILKNEITLIASAKTKVNGKSVSWWFGGSLGTGIINSDRFIIKAQRMSSAKLEYYYLTFYKH